MQESVRLHAYMSEIETGHAHADSAIANEVADKYT